MPHRQKFKQKRAGPSPFSLIPGFEHYTRTEYDLVPSYKSGKGKSGYDRTFGKTKSGKGPGGKGPPRGARWPRIEPERQRLFNTALQRLWGDGAPQLRDDGAKGPGTAGVERPLRAFSRGTNPGQEDTDANFTAWLNGISNVDPTQHSALVTTLRGAVQPLLTSPGAFQPGTITSYGPDAESKKAGKGLTHEKLADFSGKAGSGKLTHESLTAGW